MNNSYNNDNKMGVKEKSQVYFDFRDEIYYCRAIESAMHLAYNMGIQFYYIEVICSDFDSKQEALKHKGSFVSYAIERCQLVEFVEFSYSIADIVRGGPFEGYPMVKIILGARSIIGCYNKYIYDNVLDSFDNYWNSEKNCCVEELKEFKDIKKSLRDLLVVRPWSNHYYHHYASSFSIITRVAYSNISEIIMVYFYDVINVNGFNPRHEKMMRRNSFVEGKYEKLMLRSDDKSDYQFVLLNLLILYLLENNCFVIDGNVFKLIEGSKYSYEYAFPVSKLRDDFDIIYEKEFASRQQLRYLSIAKLKYLYFDKTFRMLLDKETKNINFFPGDVLDYNIVEFKDGVYNKKLDIFMSFGDFIFDNFEVKGCTYYNVEFSKLKEPEYFIFLLKDVFCFSSDSDDNESSEDVKLERVLVEIGRFLYVLEIESNYPDFYRFFTVVLEMNEKKFDFLMKILYNCYRLGEFDFENYRVNKWVENVQNVNAIESVRSMRSEFGFNVDMDKLISEFPSILVYCNKLFVNAYREQLAMKIEMFKLTKQEITGDLRKKYNLIERGVLYSDSEYGEIKEIERGEDKRESVD